MLRANLVVLAIVSLAASAADARRLAEPIRTSESPNAVGPLDGTLPGSNDARFALAATNTTWLASYSFDAGGLCDSQGWTVVDASAQIATFWHVDDFAGVNVDVGDSYAALDGAKSLWCGARASASALLCSYATLPGYGNNWNQTWQTKTCIPVSGDLEVSFLMRLDSEEGYDAAFLEYTADCAAPFTNWQTLDGGIFDWDGSQSFAHSAGYVVAGDPVKVRIRFESDGGVSDQDGDFDSHGGPLVIDNLQVEALALEDFEDEAVGATTSNDWEAFDVPGYGASYMALFPGFALVQQADACAKDLSCVWAAIAGSAATYACGGYPQQAAVPYGNSEGQFINAEIWSPMIPLTGSGSVINFSYSTYQEGSIDNLILGVWAVRSVVGGCAGRWRNTGFFIPNFNKVWIHSTQPVGYLIDAGASHVQVKLGVADLCGVWCGVFGSGACHTHTPLYDNVKVYRVDIVGPVYFTRDFDMFQDTFPVDGTDTGIGRADAALSITASNSPTVLPGDSVRIVVSDPITAVPGTNPSGLADDLALGGKQCYLWVHVIDSGVPSATKTGAALTDHANYPFKDAQVAFGKTWTRIRCYLRTPSTSTFVVDLNDNLFEAGDVIEFFFGATNTNGETSYCSGSALNYVQSDVDLAAETASEFTILPLDGLNQFLYVDGMDGRGAQVYWDTAFEQFGVTPDRYDVRGPSSNVSNRPDTRVTDVAQQLNSNYNAIVWDCGDLSSGLGDGTGAPEKSNDYAMLLEFLGGLSFMGGAFVCGDDAAQSLVAATGASAMTFKSTYLTFSLTTGNHRPSFGISPTVVGVGVGSIYGSQTFVAYGGCPLLNDFDVMTPTGATSLQMSYGAPAGTNGAVVAKTTGNSKVVLAGFSFIYIRDDDEDGVLDRARFLRDTLNPFDVDGGPLTDAPPAAANRLQQNYPNPFNPQTTIAFSLKQRARVRVDVFDVGGARIRTLLDETRAAGAYTDVRWDGTNDVNQPVASGVYFYRLVAGEFAQTRKMVLLK